MKKGIKVTFLFLLIILIVIQFVRPEKNNGGYESVMIFENETRPSSDVGLLLKENCYDCHSDQTQYPWYAEVAPISFFLNDHIKEGKKELNFSSWKGYSPKRKDHKLEELIEKLEEVEMPLKSYTLIHGEMEDKDRNLMIQWATMARLKLQQR